MNKETPIHPDKIKGILLILGLVFLIGCPFYFGFKSKQLKNNSIEHHGVLVQKQEYLTGKPLRYRRTFKIKYLINHKTITSETAVEKNIYHQFNIGDTLPILYNKKDIRHIKTKLK